MKISTLRRSVSGVAAVALVAAGVAMTAAPASAANLGALSVNPSSGNALTVPSFVAPGQCPATDNVKVNVYGGTDVAGGLIVASIPQATPKNIVGVTSAASFFNAQGGMTILSPQQWSTFASTNGLGALNGTYTLTAVCDNGDTFSGPVTFTGTNVAGATYTSPIGTSTVLAAFNGAGYGFGTSIPATATITPSSTATVTGTVAFKEGATTLASTTTISAAGVASVNITGLAVGGHSIVAVYTPDAAATSAGLTGSTSATQALTVNAGVGTVAFNGAQPASGAAGGSAAFSVACGPAAVTGTLVVTFEGASSTPIYNGSCTGAAPVNVTWNISAAQVQEAGSIKAVFTPGSASYSTPAPITSAFAVTAPAGIINNETIQVTVPVGALSATVVSNPVVVLGNWTLDASGRFNTATGLLNPVKVIDTRAGDYGWNLSVRANDFVPCGSYHPAGLTFFNTEPSSVYAADSTTGLIPGCSAPAALASAPKPYQKQAISANNLGIAASLASSTTTAAQPGTTFVPNDGVVAQPVVQPDLQLPGTGPGATKGVQAPRTIVVGTGGLAGTDGQKIGSATGVVQVNGALTLRVPTVTVAGAYATTLTITLVSNP